MRAALLVWLIRSVCLLLCPLAGHAAPQTTATLYVSRVFEVRDHDQPVKYVMNGDSRVARVTGSLGNSIRVQRLRLFSGWNLCSVAVTATNAVAQFTNSQPAAVLSDGIYLWSQPDAAWVPVTPGDTVPAGSVLWVRAATNSRVAIIGSYGPPVDAIVTTDGSFLPGAGLESWNLLAALTNTIMGSARVYDTATRRWLSRLHLPFEGASGFPAVLAPGSAAFVQSAAPALLELPDSSLSFRYYHDDHLGSASVTTDQAGALIEETAFYPFGAHRHEFQPRGTLEPYKFTGKERDGETGLHYYEARYLVSALARFTRVDEKYAHPDTLDKAGFASLLTNPQKLHPYAYVLNNPLRYVDPTGLDERQGSRVLVVYTTDMLVDAQQRMKIPKQAAYEKALAGTYAPEAGAKASITVRQVGSWAQLQGLLKGSTYDVVVINTHGFSDDKSIFIGEDKKIDVANAGRLGAFFKAAKAAPKKLFFYGCNTATSGLAEDLSNQLPDTEVTGATAYISQTVEFPDATKRINPKIKEDRKYNKTFKSGEVKSNARTADPNGEAFSRDDFR